MRIACDKRTGGQFSPGLSANVRQKRYLGDPMLLPGYRILIGHSSFWIINFVSSFYFLFQRTTIFAVHTPVDTDLRFGCIFKASFWRSWVFDFSIHRPFFFCRKFQFSKAGFEELRNCPVIPKIFLHFFWERRPYRTQTICRPFFQEAKDFWLCFPPTQGPPAISRSCAVLVKSCF